MPVKEIAVQFLDSAFFPLQIKRIIGGLQYEVVYTYLISIMSQESNLKIQVSVYTSNSKKVVFWIVALCIVVYPDRKASWM